MGFLGVGGVCLCLFNVDYPRQGKICPEQSMGSRVQRIVSLMGKLKKRDLIEFE